MSVWTHVMATMQFFPMSDSEDECVRYVCERLKTAPQGSEGGCEITVNKTPNDTYIVNLYGDLRDVGDEYLQHIEGWWIVLMTEELSNRNMDCDTALALPPLILKSGMIRADVDYGASIVWTEDKGLLKAPRDFREMTEIGGWMMSDADREEYRKVFF